MTPGSDEAFSGTVGIVGLGVVGGSLAIDLSDAGVEVLGYDIDAAGRALALAEGAVSGIAGSAEELAARCDVLCYAVPLDTLVAMLETHRGRWHSEAVVTDVASLKVPVMESAAEAGIGRRFVGSHPMAGSHGRGFRDARPGIFRGARVWLTTGEAETAAVDQVEALWSVVGAETARIDAGDHDRRMIASSHLPQLISSLLAALLESRGASRSDLGPGGRDMTRLAASSIEMWLPLLREGGPDLASLLRDYSLQAEELADAVEAGDEDALVELFARAGAWEEGR